jgi:sugar/nucleoside kinase (ribokinase family)
VTTRVTRPVLCVGILVADFFVPPLEHLPEAGELVATEDFLIAPGGCAANTAIGLATLGVPATLCGRVGDDMFGERVLLDLRGRGIDVSAVTVTKGSGTSKTVIVPVRGEDRRLIHTFGANAALTAADIPQAALESSTVVYVGGYLVLPGLIEADLAVRLREARAHGARIVLDVAVPSDYPGLSLDSIRELLPLADYFLPNEDEGLALTGEREPRDQAQAFLNCGAQTVVIKRGERGVHVLSGETSFDMPAPPVEVVEPSGAGDAFAAGLIVGILEGWDLEPSIAFASVVGGSACTALGCWAGVFSRSQADEFAASHALPAARS